jgi:xylulokinase
MQELLLGVDVGTTATKAVLVDKAGHIISQGRAEYPTKYLRAGWVEQDPADWWSSFCKAVDIALADALSAQVIGVAISAQAPTLIAVDAKGEPVRDAMIWMDRRAQAEADELEKQFANIFQLTGNRADPYYVAAKIKWFIKNEPANYQRTKYFLQIPGYLNFKLTGKFGIDAAHASLLQLRSADNSKWADEVIKFVGVSDDKFPQIANSIILQGEVLSNNQSKIAAGTPVYFGSVDGCSAALEAGVVDPGVVAEMTGTSTVLLMPTDGNNFNDAFVAIEHAIAGRQLRLGAMVASGASVAWLQQTILKGEQSVEQVSKDAQSVAPGSEGLIFLPYMMGERSPIWHTNARGVFLVYRLLQRRQ